MLNEFGLEKEQKNACFLNLKSNTFSRS